jgi:Icc-related predicted phosphoesterase
MKIIALPDLHGAADSLTAIQDPLRQADLVLLVGDLSQVPNQEGAQAVVRALQAWNPALLAVPGNWDGPDVVRFLEAQQINLHLRKVIRGKLPLIGIGGSLPTGLHAPNELPEDRFAALVADLRRTLQPAPPYVLVCHQPPANTRNDLAWNGQHVGSPSVRRLIEETQPLVCFTGHIHEGMGIDWIGQTMVINPGPLAQGSYAYVEITGEQLQTAEIRPAGGDT